MQSRVREILICSEQSKFVPNTKLRQQRIDGADLHARAAARVAQPRRGNMILPVRLQQAEGSEVLNDLLLRFGAAKALQQLLQDQAGGDNLRGTGQRFLQCRHLGHERGRITSQRK